MDEAAMIENRELEEKVAHLEQVIQDMQLAIERRLWCDVLIALTPHGWQMSNAAVADKAIEEFRLRYPRAVPQ